MNSPEDAPFDAEVSPDAKPSQRRLMLLVLTILLIFAIFLALILNNLLQIDFTHRSDTPVTSQQATDLESFIFSFRCKPHPDLTRSAPWPNNKSGRPRSSE